MKTKTLKLVNNWNITLHEKYSLFVDVESQNKFSIIDSENDGLAIFSVEENFVEFHQSAYNFNHKIDFSTRTVIIDHKPYDEEEEDA